jgi:hypothetical protein
LGCAGTGSSGNAYYLQSDNGEILMIEAGLPIDDLKKMVNYDIGNIVGCVVSHSHS